VHRAIGEAEDNHAKYDCRADAIYLIVAHAGSGLKGKMDAGTSTKHGSPWGLVHRSVRAI
jgi:hypothetical protein